MAIIWVEVMEETLNDKGVPGFPGALKIVEV